MANTKKKASTKKAAPKNKKEKKLVIFENKREKKVNPNVYGMVFKIPSRNMFRMKMVVEFTLEDAIDSALKDLVYEFEEDKMSKNDFICVTWETLKHEELVRSMTNVELKESKK